MRLIITIILCSLFYVSNAQEAATRWFKGNTHTHSYWSDGNDFPEMIMDWYKTRGYDFIALSDHNILADTIKWKPISKHPFRQKRFEEYLQKFGKDWVVYRTDSAGQISVKLKTLAEYKPMFEEEGKFLIMQAEEISDSYSGKPLHIGAVNIRDIVRPQGGSSVTDVLQRNLDAVYAQRERTGQPMFPHINHPNFIWAIKLEDMIPLRGERFFEVYNGHPHVHNYGDSTEMGMEELWDRLQIHYINAGKPLLYGLATDDAHDFIEYKVGSSNPGRGWIMVKADKLDAAVLIEAMEKGDFYSTTGVELKEVQFEKRKLKVSVQPEEGVEYTIQVWGGIKGKEKGVLLKEVKGTSLTYKKKRNQLFIRAKVISSKIQENPFAEGDMETAWTQPVM